MDEKTKLRTLERTFGLEIEMADVDKYNVELPNGFEWNDIENIHNTDGTIGTPSSRYGGELNTPPLLLNCKSRETLRHLYKSMIENGGNARRDIALQVHIFAGDLNVDELKRIFFLCYYTSNILKEVCHEPPYTDEQLYRPSPTLQAYQRIRDAKDIYAVRGALENSANKGYERFFVNIASYFVHQTVEFRLFNATLNVNEVFNCILFAYRFFDYAMTHTEDDFRQIKTTDAFRRIIKVPQVLPALPPELLYFSSVREQAKGVVHHKSLHLSNPLLGVLMENTGDEVVCVNPYLYSVEMRLMSRKKLSIYNNDEFHHIIYLAATGELRITYGGYAEFLQKFNDGTPASQVACLLILRRLKALFADTDYAIINLNSYKNRMEETYRKALGVSVRIGELFKNAEYHLGTLNDALLEEKDVFFQFDSYSRFRSVVGVLRKNSDYEGNFERRKTYYDGIPADIGNAKSLCMVSTNQYLPMDKIAQMGDKWFYKTECEKNGKLTFKISQEHVISFPIVPDGTRIEDASLLRVCAVSPKLLLQAQEAFVKKVVKKSLCRFAYLVYYDKFLIGGFGFDYPKKDDDYDVWLLSDFCTNNHIPRLSKLILLIIKSAVIKKSLSRKFHLDVSNLYTKVYTHNMVSMKYRGVFKLAARETHHLVYATELGIYGTFDDVLRKYFTYLK